MAQRLSFLLFFITWFGLQAGAQVTFYNHGPLALNCAGTFVDTVEVGADTLTVHTVFTANPQNGGYDWPTIEQTITYADGHALLERTFGAKLIDEIASCDDWFAVGHNRLVSSLKTAEPTLGVEEWYGGHEIEEVRACLADLAACETREWRITDEAKAFTLEAFDALVAGPARMFYLTEGAYIGATMIFDIEGRRLIPIYQGGC